MKIDIETIPHNCQRYPTCGDFLTSGDVMGIKVSEMGDWRYEMLIAIHELVEVMLCKQAGIPEALVDQFDMDYEKNRKPGDHSEPGDDLRAPYRRQHFVATNIERQIAHELGVDWQAYCDAVEAL